MDHSLDQEGIPDLEGPLPEKVATGDPQEGAAPPADRPASLDYGTTAAEQRREESLDRRLAREVPDRPVRGDAERVVLVAPEDEDPTAEGALDDEGEAVGRAADAGTGNLSAEEAAVHVDRPDH
jgi:hypothetical protein